MAGLFIGVTMAFPRRAGWRVGEESQTLVGAQAGRTPGHPRGRSARCCHAGAPTDDINAPSTVRPLHATPTGQNA